MDWSINLWPYPQCVVEKPKRGVPSISQLVWMTMLPPAIACVLLLEMASSVLVLVLLS